MPATSDSAGTRHVFRVRTLTLPKGDRCPQENEDVFVGCALRGRFALADGASDSAYSGRWARQLAEHFIATGPWPVPPRADQIEAWLAPLRRTWHGGIEWARLPWYGEEKARTGGFSTLLGLELGIGGAGSGGVPDSEGVEEGEPVVWRVQAVGDSCFFHWRAGQLLRSFPLGHSSDFDLHPGLLGSNPALNRGVVDSVRWLQGCGRMGDCYLLATDALAQCLMSRHEEGEDPWTFLVEEPAQDQFMSWVNRLREDRAMRNDDVTLVTVRLEASAVSSADGVGSGVDRV